MRTSKTLMAVGLALFMFTALITAARAQGILNTRHNLSSSSTQPIHTTGDEASGTGTARVCVFCHTPHGADTGVAAPLWNRAQTQAAFQVYSSPTLDAAPGQPNGTSLACLSCHDGTVAFDALRNLPGSGGFTDSATVPSAGWTFVGADAGNLMPAAGITNIGTDLRNDHPVSMEYDLARSPSSGSADGTTGFRLPVTDGNKRCVGNPVPADCSDPGALPLSSSTIGGPADFVQCTSCHDPHRSDTPTFLRKSNDASALCLTCHVKDA